MYNRQYAEDNYLLSLQCFYRFSISSTLMTSLSSSLPLIVMIVGDVSERALREIYLKPFQIAVKDANPWALMTSCVSFNVSSCAIIFLEVNT